MAYRRLGFERSRAGSKLAHGSATVWLLAASCSPTRPPPAQHAVAPSPAPSAASASFEDRPWGTFRSKRFELALRLPDGARWKIDDHRTPWLRAEHPPTQSALWLRAWSEEVTATRQGCYARARDWLPRLPVLENANLIDDRVRPLFASLDTRVAVGVEPAASGGLRTQGFVVAAGAAVRRCFVVVFVTHADGAGADDAVGERLALVSERLLDRVQLDQSLAPSREPVTPSLRGAAGAAR